MSLKSIALGITFIAASAASLQAKRLPADDFNYHADRFADIEVLRYQVPGFSELPLSQKLYIYYLTEAALAGRDIHWDQNNRHNLAIRCLLEDIYTGYQGPTDRNYQEFVTYLKRIWFANGIHHHYSMDKILPGFSEEWLREQISALPEGKRPADTDLIVKAICDSTYMPKKVNQAEGADLIVTSATNIYGDGITQKEVEDYYNSIKDPADHTPVSYGLNTRKVKRDGKIVEEAYKIGGVYSPAIERIVYNLKRALPYAENERQKEVINSLIDYYTTGDLKKFDEYSILWAGETDGRVDFINGFIETYDDPLGMTGQWESIVNFKNLDASHRTEVLSSNAQWFEDHSPVDSRFKKDKVKGVSAKVITAAILAGDSYPATPIGINLPNANWIRANHGSKSVTIENITDAYDKAAHGNGFKEEFVIDEPTMKLMDEYGFVTDNLHTDLHECLGHGSGRLLPGVSKDALKAHASTIEEARADLFALYYLADPKLIELGLLDNPDAYKAQYYEYMLNGLMTQLMRIEPGKDIEEAHMRNRKLIAEWAYEKGLRQNVVEKVTRDGKTYIKINDYARLRELFGELLEIIQRITSEGDYDAAANLVETYGVKVDPQLHAEVLDRYSHLDIAPYKGFVNPRYVLIVGADGNPEDVIVTYGEPYDKQMLRYSKSYSPLTNPSR